MTPSLLPHQQTIKNPIKAKIISSCIIFYFSIFSSSLSFSQPSTKEWIVCERMLSTFHIAYSAGSLTAFSLNDYYRKQKIEEKKYIKKSALISKNEMIGMGIRLFIGKDQERMNTWSCWIHAYKDQNIGFITGFREKLSPELKAIYLSVPMF